jgi:hypothetical protein
VRVAQSFLDRSLVLVEKEATEGLSKGRSAKCQARPVSRDIRGSGELLLGVDSDLVPFRTKMAAASWKFLERAPEALPGFNRRRPIASIHA